ncbi:MAG: HAMP domain-containing histidine kinase, partial [Bacteroidetes bacterium]|nr:HAMP domain-containing histidine kinase [Bacteroidota bacterium]
LSSYADKELKASVATTQRSHENIKFDMLLVIGFCLVIGTFISINLTRSISIPIKDLIRNTSQVAEGNLRRINHKYHNEMGDLVNSFNKMIVALTKSKDDSERKELELQTFIYKASHDLRGPFCSVMGLSNLAREQVKDKQALVYFNLIDRSVSRLDQILKDLARVAMVQQSLVIQEEFDFEEEINGILEGIQQYDNFDKIDIQIKIDVKNKFFTDKSMLVSILQNIIINSVKYQKLESSDSFIQINITEGDNFVNINIDDNGVGIEEVLQPKIFDMFFRANESSTGSGLGLYIVKNAVEKLGGEITLTSIYKIGTSVNMKFAKKLSRTHVKQLDTRNDAISIAS